MPAVSNTSNPAVLLLDPSADGLLPVAPSQQPTLGRETLDRLMNAEWEAQATAAVLEILVHAESCDRLERACAVLADEFRNLLGCDRVVVAISDKGLKAFRLLSSSGTARIDRSAEITSCLEAALAETLVHKDVTIWPPQPGSSHLPMLAHERLSARSGDAQIVSSPLRNAAGLAIGAWLFLGKNGFSHLPQNVGLISACEPRVATCLQLLQRGERGPLARLAQRTVASGHSWRRRSVLGILCLLVAGLFLPVHYRVDCKCKLQPVVRRFVTAPFDGPLEKSLAEPGDIVAEGQTLARIDGREVRWEASGLQADRNRAEVKRNTSLAKHDMGAARMAALETERLELKLRLLQRRADHLEIKSPIRGVIVGGDLKRAEGMPVTVGQGLFEVAPLDQMIFELAVPEQEFARVAIGQEVTARLDAFPQKLWRGTIAKIYPRAESRDSEKVFLAELAVDGSDESLRPGMNGRAKIVTRRHFLLWILMHKPWEQLQEALGW